MFINIESSDSSLLERVYNRLSVLKPLDEIVVDTMDALAHEYNPGSTRHVVTSIDNDFLEFQDLAGERWGHLSLAAAGARFWVDESVVTSTSPIYAGKIDGSDNIVDKIIIDATYAESKAVYYKSFGVNYVGRTFTDPRTIVLVDYKGDKRHDPASDPIIHDILSSLPDQPGVSESSWSSFGLVSCSNVDRLRDFLECVDETNILTYSVGGAAKLRHLGRDFGQVSQPRADRSYGLELREKSSRLHLTN